MSAQVSLTNQFAHVDAFVQRQIDNICDFVIKQRLEGACVIDIPYHAYSLLQTPDLNEVHRVCQQATGSVFFRVVSCNGDCSFTATAPMPSPPDIDSAASASSPDTNSTDTTKKSGTKVPRPRNAFLIYRGAHHDAVKAKNPGIHNNDISKIIGRRWADETQAVKDDYKRKAEEEKRQHAIAHPGYQYQPRKPSEKKKRMTKNKLAKLAAISRSNDATADATILPAQQNGQITVDTFMPPYQNNTSHLDHFEGIPAAAFNVVPGDAGDDGLRDQLALLNSDGSQPQANALGVPAPVYVATQLRNGENVRLTPNRDSFDFDAAEFPTEWVYNPTTTVEETHTPDPYAEQRRQEQLEREFERWIDFTGGIGDDDLALLFGSDA